MKISIITLFPETLRPILDSSIIGRAQKRGVITIDLVNLRDFGQGRHQVVDGRPYGGGVGMLLRADILAKALKSINQAPDNSKVILTSASGQTFHQALAKELSLLNELIIVCGHYEGVDQRFIDKYVDLELSIGDYVLTGGEIPALAITDTVARLVKGVLTKEETLLQESFEHKLLEYPHFTRPATFEGLEVPEILKSGHHEKIEQWRRNEAVKKTKKFRPDLLKET